MGGSTKGRYRRPGVPDCIEDGCANSQWRYAYCRHHWIAMPLDKRFWLEVDKSGKCWIWQGQTRSGYGRIKVNYVSLTAHRVAYELLVGAIPDGLVLDHLCGETLCVNPDHLEPVTQAENVSRSHEAHSGSAPRTSQRTWRPPPETCVNGHDLTDPANAVPIAGRYGRKACLLCAEMRRAASRKPEGEPRRTPPPAQFCQRGHEFTPESVTTSPSRQGRRVCRECQRERKRRYYRQKRISES